MIQAVRAKMKCNTTEQAQYEHGYTSNKVKLGAVYSTKGENADFSAATPSGECWMNIDAGVPAASFFKPGKSYYVTFTEAPD